MHITQVVSPEYAPVFISDAHVLVVQLVLQPEVKPYGVGWELFVPLKAMHIAQGVYRPCVYI